MKIKKGDQVKIISGNDKGKQARVLAVSPVKHVVIVEGANMKKKHVRARRQGEKGELVRIPAPIPVSRVMMVCPSCSRPTRLGFQTHEGKKSRVCKKCRTLIP